MYPALSHAFPSSQKLYFLHFEQQLDIIISPSQPSKYLNLLVGACKILAKELKLSWESLNFVWYLGIPCI